ncbi:uncharacterized protein GGS22DRAFT_143612 [Annulohypoxylon maeteangense]|uniref:uncharacterized protein n=1 Tax=Annulohypoxylon maeteangense TaxID=1927788 RepID=UPI0020072A10|nr:uncharacterized protein GGS22DRAFT_143612 [Annulohypoxylon maeteangense]KAI0884510.1 hypothetical protein GGS22DRAFT_143612 [Annulohypoxylon maeteangense]
MVSQLDQSLTLRGPSSVISARSSSRPHASSRSKRYNRSHAGGSSYAPQNEFPIFSHSGDVEILIKAGGKENRYLLHRHTLTRCSGFFEASTSQEWSKASLLPLPEASSRELARIGEEGSINGGSEVARPGANSPIPRKRWRYELDPGSGADDIPMLIQKEANTSTSSSDSTQSNSIFGGGGTTANTPATRKAAGHSHSHSHTHSTNSFFRSVANLSLVPTKVDQNLPLAQADADLLRDYDNLFRIFYNYSPMLDSVNIADAYVQCKSLLTLADQYDALAVVGPRVDHHLLQFQSRLWKQIAKYPVSYLRLGYLSRSKVIFQEALIHVVGQWPAGERSIRQSFPDIVLDIIEDKVDELEETVSRIESRLFRLNLTTSRGERVTPGTSYLDWLAISFFRQWLADNTSPAPLPPPASTRAYSSRDGGNSSRNTAVVASAPTAPNLASLGRTYRTLGSAAGYLGHDDCKRFLKITSELYSRDNLRRFEKRIDELKTAAREIVRPLMGSGLELELERGATTPGSAGIGGPGVPISPSGMTSYLTCVRVMERDLPWAIED